MNIHNSIKHFITTHALIERDAIIIVGLSGGPDSVFLLHFLVEFSKEIPITLIVAHLNHEWRQEAEQEEQLCSAIADKFGLQYIATKISELTLPFKSNGSKEEYARKARRYFFQKLAHEHNANAIALAHHLQDQEETFFIRLIRGSSLTGLTAIKPRNSLYIRPLLETNKNDILDWLHTHNITYAVDASNDSQQYLRNRIRSSILPALRECDNRFETNFLTTLHRLTATEIFLHRLTEEKFAQIATKQHRAKNSIVTHAKSSQCARPEQFYPHLQFLSMGSPVWSETQTGAKGSPRALKDTLQQVQGERVRIYESDSLSNLCYIINIPDLLTLDPILQHRVILHWLIKENVPFPITQAFLDEIIRFLSTAQGGKHAIHEKWSLIKKQKKASLVKI